LRKISRINHKTSKKTLKTIQNTWQDISWNRGNKKANKFVKVEEICSRIQWIKRKRDKKK
jgi:hypothetical protein